MHPKINNAANQLCAVLCLAVSDSVTPWTVACQAPLSMEFSRQEYWSRLHFLLQEIAPNQHLLHLLHWQIDSLSLSHLSVGSVAHSYPTLCDPMDCSMPGFLVHHHLQELAQTHVHWVSDVIQSFHPLSSPSPAFSLSQYQGLFQRISWSHEVAKVLELQLQCQSFQWIFRTDFL